MFRLFVVAVLLAAALSLVDAEEAFAREAVASWVGSELAGSPMANGEPFDPAAYTVAHRDIPLGTYLVVCGEDACILAVVTDRGPWLYDRDFDVSAQVAWEIGIMDEGVGVIYVYDPW